jgi:threonine dehydrogenase-like Zn-dependent dehydrogenase
MQGPRPSTRSAAAPCPGRGLHRSAVLPGTTAGRRFTNICGSDQHMVRRRTTAPAGLVLGHEITGEVVEVGPGVEFIKEGDLCSVPFNIACGRCRNCKHGDTGVCENTNPDRPGSAYGYVDMGGWVGGQANYVLVPYADWNLIEQILGVPEVDCAVDCVGFEARGHGADAGEAPATVLNAIMDVTRAAGALGIPGLYVTDDPGASDDAAKKGALSLSLGTGWAKSLSFTTGQCPVMRYHRQLMMAILHDRAHIADAVNATVITLDEAPKGYQDFDSGAARKYVLDPNNLTAA